MGERAYVLLENLGHVVCEMEEVISGCDAEEPMAVKMALSDVTSALRKGQKLIFEHRRTKKAIDGDQL